MTKRPSKKASTKRASKAHTAKLVKAEIPIALIRGAKVVRSSKVSARPKRNPEGISRFWGSAEDFESTSYKRLPRLPNPWPPSDIIALVKIACSTAGLAGIAYKLIKLWFDSRNAKKIRIKKGDYELEIQGSMSKTEIERRITQFRALTKGLDEDEIKVILPSSIDKSLPSERPVVKDEAENNKVKIKKGNRKETKGRLNESSVTLLVDSPFVLQCNECDAVWSPKIQKGGRLPRNYWHCPNGCNRPKVRMAVLLN
jgi:hypothetical protein